MKEALIKRSDFERKLQAAKEYLKKDTMHPVAIEWLVSVAELVGSGGVLVMPDDEVVYE